MKLRLRYGTRWDALGICLWPVWWIERKLGPDVLITTAEYPTARAACDAVRAGALS
jgi:hypothetical protein